YVLTLLVAGLPIAQRKTYLTQITGGGIIYDFAYRIFGFPLFKTSQYKKINRNIPSLNHNYLLSQTFFALSDSEIFEKAQKLCENMDLQSKNIVYQIISRTKAATLSPTQKVFHLTQHEKTALQHIENDFFANICELTPEVFYYQGYFLPTKHFEISVFYYKHGLDSFSSQTLAKIKNLDVIDVGGFIGDSALIFQSFTNKNIYSFEATSHNYNLMLQTLKLNNTNHIVPVKKGLGSEKTTMTISILDSASSLIRDNTPYGSTQSEEIELITLDSYVKEHNLKIGLIKVDIEGFEMEFLKGAKETICSQKPAMILSIYHQASDFFDIKPMLESWNLGYTFRIYKPIDYNISLETTLMCEVLD
ncbi:FkbM family methyltransferase, partial [Helicobacter cinaedi]